MKLLVVPGATATTLQRQLQQCRSFRIASALITPRGLDECENAMRKALARGAQGMVLFGVDLPTYPEAIERLLLIQKAFPKRFTVRRSEQYAGHLFHPKIAILDRGTSGFGIVGSSNLTGGGLRDNFEVNLLTSDRALLNKLRDHFDAMFEGSRARTVTLDWLDLYRQHWARRLRALKEITSLVPKPKRHAADEPPNRIRGESFAFTGRIDGWPRQRKLYPTIKRLGGRVGTQRTGHAQRKLPRAWGLSYWSAHDREAARGTAGQRADHARVGVRGLARAGKAPSLVTGRARIAFIARARRSEFAPEAHGIGAGPASAEPCRRDESA